MQGRDLGIGTSLAMLGPTPLPGRGQWAPRGLASELPVLGPRRWAALWLPTGLVPQGTWGKAVLALAPSQRAKLTRGFVTALGSKPLQVWTASATSFMGGLDSVPTTKLAEQDVGSDCLQQEEDVGQAYWLSPQLANLGPPAVDESQYLASEASAEASVNPAVWLRGGLPKVLMQAHRGVKAGLGVKEYFGSDSEGGSWRRLLAQPAPSSMLLGWTPPRDWRGFACGGPRLLATAAWRVLRLRCRLEGGGLRAAPVWCRARFAPKCAPWRSLGRPGIESASKGRRGPRRAGQARGREEP